jgi:hypothetical protein
MEAKHVMCTTLCSTKSARLAFEFCSTTKIIHLVRSETNLIKNTLIPM